MADSFFTFTPFDFNEVQGSYSPQEIEEALFKQRQDQYLFGIKLGEANPIISNEYGFQQEQTAKKGVQLLKEHLQHQQPTSNDLIMDEFDFRTISISPPAQAQHQQPKSNAMTLDEFHFNTIFPPTQPIHETTGLTHIPAIDSDIPKYIKQIPQPYSSASIELLRNYRRGFKKLKGEKLNETSTETKVGSYKLSTEEIMRVAGERYVRFSTQNQIYDDYCMPKHPFGSALLGLSEEETRDVELAHLLLAAAEKVGYRQYERASKLPLRCEWISSARANPAQRVVFHFAEALQERIDKELGRAPMKEFKPYEEIFLGVCTNPSIIRAYEKLPFSQIAVFTGIEAILENVALEPKVHLLDIGIRCGAHWTVLMKALAEQKDCPIELLIITAVEFTGNKYGDIDETRKRLVSVAESLNLPFSFKSVLLSDIKDIREKIFEIEDYEAVIVYAPHILWTMISTPDCLDSLMRVIRNLSPDIMVVVDIEANQNSPSFVNRFIEALFFHSAYYDCLETCISRNDDDRMAMETLLSNGIRSIVAEEGGARKARSVKMDVWRAFFARFRMAEIGLSESCLEQARLVVKQFVC